MVATSLMATQLLAAATNGALLAELGAVLLVLAVVGRFAMRVGLPSIPLYLIGADTRIVGQQAPAFLTEALARDQSIPYVMIADTTHFLQIERPRQTLDAMEIFLSGQLRNGTS